MSISLTEKLVSLPGATRLLPGRPHISTLWRWATRGVRSVRLETTLIGGRRYTSHEALERFIDRTTGSIGSAGGHPQLPSARMSAIKKAKEELANDGF